MEEFASQQGHKYPAMPYYVPVHTIYIVIGASPPFPWQPAKSEQMFASPL